MEFWSIEISDAHLDPIQAGARAYGDAKAIPVADINYGTGEGIPGLEVVWERTAVGNGDAGVGVGLSGT